MASGFGSLVSGFQQGYNFSKDARRDRQVEKYLDDELAKKDRARRGADASAIAESGSDAILTDMSGALDDPWAFKLANAAKRKITGMFGGGQQSAIPNAPATSPAMAPSTTAVRQPQATPRAQAAGQQASGARTMALPSRDMPFDEYEGMPPGGDIGKSGQRGSTTPWGSSVLRNVEQGGGNYPLHVGGVPYEEYMQGGYADGGVVRYADGGAVPSYAEMTEEEKIRERAARNRSARPASVATATEAAPRSALPDPKTSRVADWMKPSEGVKKVGRTIAKGGKLLGKTAPAALAFSAVDTAGTDTEDYRERFGMETDDPSLMGDIGVRTLGAVTDVANTLSFGQLGKHTFKDKQKSPSVPPDAQAAIEALPAEEPANVAAQPMGPPQDNVGGATGGSGGTGAGQAIPAQGEDPNAPTDWSQIDVLDMPNMPTRDWVQYRKQSVAGLMAQGMTAEQAHDSVTGMQQKGFVRDAQQAFQLMEAGNLKAASAALKSAYQYFPNGVDVKFGIKDSPQGQVLVGMGYDEETGKPTGKPMLINAERLSVMIENMSNPAAFRTWTKDWRDEAFRNKKYEEIDKPAAEGQLDYQRDIGQAARTRADAELARAGGAGGLRQSDYDRAYNAFMQSQEFTELSNPAEAEELAAVMAMIYQRTGGQRGYPEVIRMVMGHHRDGTLDQALEELLGPQ